MGLVEKYGKQISEREAKVELKNFGIPVPEEKYVNTPKEAEKAVEEVGLPAIIKIDSKEISHKTDIGCVKEVQTHEKIVSTAEEVIRNGEKAVENNHNLGLIISEKVEGNEFIAGINNDPQFGKVFMFGLGGIHVETFKDVVFRPLPVDETDISEMIEEIRSKKLLEGVRGQPATDKEKLISVLRKVAEFGSKEEVEELDINPLFIRGDEINAADALIKLREL